jgi:phospholipid-translocating ATPase
MIYEFEGQYVNNEHSVIEPLGLEHTLWANTVLASSGYIIGMVIYTGAETRAMMN